MDDTIYRRAAIVALLEKGQHSRRYKFGDIWELNYDEIRETLNALPAAGPKSYSKGYQDGMAAAQQWIPCSERLPEDDVEVLVTDDAGGVQWLGVDKMMSYEDGSGRFWLISQHPSAWMPLPEPYKEKP